jgi:hypothetical protein
VIFINVNSFEIIQTQTGGCMPDEERYDTGTIYHEDAEAETLAGAKLEAEIVADRERRTPLPLPRFEDCIFEHPSGRLRLFVCWRRGDYLTNGCGIGFSAIEAYDDLLAHQRFIEQEQDAA